jgi:hypothetical protein
MGAVLAVTSMAHVRRQALADRSHGPADDRRTQHCKDNFNANHQRNERKAVKIIIALTLAVAAGAGSTACTRDVQAMDAQQIERQYGVGGASDETIATADGPVKGTLVPITLANGRQGHLFIPQKQTSDPHGVYVRDEQGLHPVQLKEHATREEIAHAPVIVDTKPEATHTNKRSWEKEALIIGGSAGAGTAIGAMAGGKKGAAVGATAGGVGGLIYDLVTRNKK